MNILIFHKKILGNNDDCNRFDFDPRQIKKLLEDHLKCKYDNNQILCDIVNLILLDEYTHAWQGHSWNWNKCLKWVT